MIKHNPHVLFGSIFTIIILLFSFFQTAYAAVSDPILPAVYLDTTYQNPTGKSVTVTNSTELQQALSQAVGGDEIVLDATKSFTGPITLPVHSGTSRVILRS